MAGSVLRAIDDVEMREKTTVFVVSDHGILTAPKSIRPNALSRKEKILTVDERGRVATARVHVISEGGIGMIYLTDPDTSAADRETARRLFEGKEGVATILGAEDFAKNRLPTTATQRDMVDMIIACKEGYSVGALAGGDSFVVDQDGSVGVHGHLSTEPKIRAVFVASGPNIKRGLKLKTVDNSDVAPTVARILGVPLPTATGRVVEEIFTLANPTR